jgi:hypothetical protein
MPGLCLPILISSGKQNRLPLSISQQQFPSKPEGRKPTCQTSPGMEFDSKAPIELSPQETAANTLLQAWIFYTAGSQL